MHQFKNIGLLSAILVTFMISSCGDSFLDEKPKSFFTPDNAYTQPDYIEQGIVGLHAQTRSWWVAGEAVPTAMFALGTDLSYHGEDPGNGAMMNYPNYLTPSGSATSAAPLFWIRSYGVIQKANVLIDAINKLEDASWQSVAEKNASLGEAMFFRALCYRTLVYLYGDVPLVTEVIDYPKTDFVRAPKAEVYALMEEDLKFAAANLPARGLEKAAGRITRGAAWHLLSEIYLAQSKFQDAVNAASNVIGNDGYALMTHRFGTKLGNDIFGSGDPYFDLFGYGNHNLSENTEGLWVLQLVPNVIGGGQNQSERAFGAAYYRMGNTPDGVVAFRGELYNGAYTGYTDTLGRPVSWNRPTTYVTHKIWGNGQWDIDKRNAEHNIKRHYYFDNPNSSYHGQEIKWSLYADAGVTRPNPMMDTVQYLFPYYMKAASPLDHFVDLGRSGGGQSHKCHYAFRLAETYLIRAEAYLGLNDLDKAAADINVIRNRAEATPVIPGDVTIDYILDERARELYAEEWRMLTLMRLGKLVERVRLYNNNPLRPGLDIQDYNNLWPIPQSEIDRNIDAVLTQNPGYPQ